MMTSPSPPQGSPPQDYRLHAILFLLAICIRLFFLVWIDEPILFFKYPFFAEKITAGKDIGERLVDLSPFYLYYLAFFKKLFGASWPFIKGFQIVIGGVNTLLVFMIGTRLFTKGAAFIGAVIFAVYGNLIVFETTLEPTVFVLFFNLLSVYFLLLFNSDTHTPNRKIWITLAAGIFTGLGIITKPNFLLFIPAGIVWIVFCRETAIRFNQRLSHSLLFLVAAFFVITPITVINYVKFNDFILVTADAGKVFFHGNSDTATALSGADLYDDGRYQSGRTEPDYAHVLFRETASRVAGRPLTPSESSSFWVDITLQDIEQDPIHFIKRCVKKIAHFFMDYEIHYIASAYKEYKESLKYPFLHYGVIVSLGCLGMGLSIRNFWSVFLLYETIGLYLISCTLFLVSSRYRIPAIPVFCIFAGYAVVRLKDMATAHQPKQISISLLILFAAYATTHLIFRKDVAAHDNWHKAVKIHYEVDARSAFNAGRYHDSVTSLTKCITTVPDFSPAFILRGKGHVMMGNHEKALADFQTAMRLNPENAEGYQNIGFLYLIENKPKLAESFLKQALQHDPHNKRILDALDSLHPEKRSGSTKEKN